MPADHPRQGGSQTIRCLRMIELLFSHVLDGMSNKELAAHLHTTPPNVSRDAALLAECGWLQTLPNGRYALTDKPISLNKIYQLHLDDIAARAGEFNRRAEARARQYLNSMEA